MRGRDSSSPSLGGLVMLFDELKHGIDEFYKRLKVDNPFFSKAMDGTLAPEQLSVFLDNLAMVMEGNIVNTRFAEEESRKRGLTNLAEYFRKKYDEEGKKTRITILDMPKIV